MIAAIPRNQVDDHWLKVKPLLESALEYGDGDLTIEDVYSDLMDGTQVLLVVYDGPIKAAITMEMVKGRRKRWMNTVLCGGSDTNDWLPEWMDAAEELAREQGAELMVTGRRGWLKKLKPFGFQEAYTVARYERREIQ